MFGHLDALPVPKKSVGLINKEYNAVALILGPVEEFVHLADSEGPEGGDVRAHHHRVLQTRLQGQFLREKGLTRAGRAVKHQVLTRRIVLLTV